MSDKKGDKMVVAEFGKGNVLITPSVDGDFEKGCLILRRLFSFASFEDKQKDSVKLF